MSLNVTSQTFKSEVLDYQGLVLVDFWATWCGPCQMLSPTIDEIGQQYSEKLKVVKVDVDANGDIADQYNISAIPTVILFDHGQVKQVITGFHQKQEYLSAIAL